MGDTMNVVNAGILQRTVRIHIGECIGTAFTVDVEMRQYLITAKHCVAVSGEANAHCEVGVFGGNGWWQINARIVGVTPNDDVAVLALDRQLTPAHPLKLTSGGTIFSQEVFFLGFPYGLHTAGPRLNGGLPLPLVKRALVSGSQPRRHLINPRRA